MAKPALSREERRDETRGRILRAAVTEFARAGFDGAAMGTVSERAGVAHGTVFWHFDRKSRLYLEAVGLAAETLLEQLLPVASKRGASFMQVIDRMIECLSKNPEIHALLSSLRGEHPNPIVREATRVVDTRLIQLWRTWIDVSGTVGRWEPPSGSHRSVARLIASTVSGVLAMRFVEEDIDVRAVLADFGALIETPIAGRDGLLAAGRAHH